MLKGHLDAFLSHVGKIEGTLLRQTQNLANISSSYS